MSDSSSDSDQDESKDQENGNVDDQDDDVTFASLGLEEVLCDAAARMGWKKPSKIQKEAIPVAIAGNDVIGLAETGSGKTGAFALPMLQDLIKNPTRLFGLVLTPTRELAYQIAEQFDKLGSELALKTVTLVGKVKAPRVCG
jgi:ATP-dependent RNA helicase DDX47/RRP3